MGWETVGYKVAKKVAFMKADQDKTKHELLLEVAALRRQLKTSRVAAASIELDTCAGVNELPLSVEDEHELRLRAEMFANITLALTSHISLDALLDEILEQAQVLVPYKTANIALLEGDMLVVKRWRGYVNEGFMRNLSHRLSEAPLEVEAFRTRQAIVIEDTWLDPRWQIWDELGWIRSYVGIPIVLPDRILGILRLDGDIVGQFSEKDIERLQPLASAAAIALEKAHLYEQAQAEIAARAEIQETLEKVNFELEQRVIQRTKEYLTAKKRVEVILDSSSDGIFFAYPDRGIQQTNRAFNSLFHCDQDDYFGLPITTLVCPEDHLLLGAMLDAVMQDGMTRHLEIEMVRKDGSHFDAEIGIAHMKWDEGEEGIVYSLRDISLRKQIEWALRRSEAKMRSILDNSAAIIYANDLDDRIIMVNRQYEKIFNVNHEEILGTHLEKVFPKETLSQFRENNRLVLETQQTLEFEEAVWQEDGMHTYLTIKSPLFDEQGKPYAVCGISTDITERKKTEIELRQALEKQKELTELKTRFVSMASHEFRTPLATIQAASDALKAYMSKMTPEQITNRLDKIQMQIKHMVQLLTDVLTLEQIQVGKLQHHPVQLDLVSFCREIVDDLHTDRLPRIEFECDLTSLDYQADEKLLRQVIANLLTNALKYSLDDTHVELSLQAERNQIVLTIKDYGIGIPEADQEHLFEPFYRATNVGTTSGSGLGLVIAKQAVELHHGTINFESQSGMGTIFTVILPLNAESSP